MARKHGRNHKPARQISVRAVRRDRPDLRRLSRALIALALAEHDAERQHGQTDADGRPRRQP